MPEKTSEPHGAQVVLSGGNTAPERTTNTNINTSTNEYQHESLHVCPLPGVVSCVCNTVVRPFRYTKFKLRSRQRAYRMMLRCAARHHRRGSRRRMEAEDEEEASRDDEGMCRQRSPREPHIPPEAPHAQTVEAHAHEELRRSIFCSMCPSPLLHQRLYVESISNGCKTETDIPARNFCAACNRTRYVCEFPALS